MTELSREEIAKLEIGQTEIRPALAWLMVVAFLGTLVAVPTIEIAHERQADRAGKSESPWPRCVGIFRTLPNVAETISRGAKGT